MDDIERIEAEADEAYRRLERPRGMEHIKVTVRLAPGQKCPRCWHYHTVAENHDNLCDRCCLAILEGWPDHESVPHIQASRAKQAAKYAVPATAPGDQRPLAIATNERTEYCEVRGARGTYVCATCGATGVLQRMMVDDCMTTHQAPQSGRRGRMVWTETTKTSARC